jgi:hypothetical protein
VVRADHLRATRPQGHHHDGIDLGDGRVIHLAAGPGESKTSACVRIDSFETFANGGVVTVRHYSGTRDPEEVVARAMSRLGVGGDYDLVFNNCEHFARWCVTEVHLSEQVVAVTSTGGVVGATAAAAAVGIDVVASAGAVAGLSGPGIMSGLASAGALVGGGAVAGIVTIGALPATASVILVNRALKDDEHLPEEERDARSVGRVGTVAGAGAAAIGSVSAVSAMGAIAGLSGPGIASGLAAIGAGFGGGMAAGTMVVIAAPAAGAAVVGYGLYRLYRLLNPSRQP